MARDDTSKASDDEASGTAENAVDRASSRTPLNDDSGIDPERTREQLAAKREKENARTGDAPDNPNVGPGPVRAKPNSGPA